jgi:hypothetical protein
MPEATMNAIFGIALVLIGLLLIATREWSAQFHERWNSRFRWTQWATGPRAMTASRTCNVIVGAGFIVVGLVILL